MARWAGWLSGALLLVGLVLVVAHWGEGERFAALLREARPAWLAVGAALQVATYFCAAGVWQRALRGNQVHRTVSSLVPLGLAKLFTDQALPSAGVSGTLVVVRGLSRRGVVSPLAMSAMLAGLLALYVAYAVSVAGALGALWLRGELSRLVLGLATAFSLVAVAVPLGLFALRGHAHRIPDTWLHRLPGARDALEALASAPPGSIWTPRVAAETIGLQVAIFALDAATLDAMLRAVASVAPPGVVFSSFMLASVVATLAWVPGGIGTFEGACVSVLSRHGVAIEPALAATLLLRGLTFWLPMLPGLWLTRRELVAAPDAPRES